MAAQAQQVQALGQLEMQRIATQQQKNQGDLALKAQAQAEDAWQNRADAAIDLAKVWTDAEDSEKARLDLLARRLAVTGGVPAVA